MDAVDAFRKTCSEPEPSHAREVPLRTRISSSRQERPATPYYDALPAIVQEYMDKVNAKIGTDYKLFNYYGAADAEHVIIAMGSVCDTIEETIDYLMSSRQEGRRCQGSSVQTVLCRGSGRSNPRDCKTDLCS